MVQTDVDVVLDQIRESGGRITGVTRRLVQIAVDYPHDHFRGSDFVEYANTVEPVTESTVYRILDRLVAYGVLERSQLGSGPPRFHLRPFHHVHLVCYHCGRITDAPETLLDNVAQRLDADYRFELDAGLSSLNGTCSSCRAVHTDADDTGEGVSDRVAHS